MYAVAIVDLWINAFPANEILLDERGISAASAAAMAVENCPADLK